MAWTFTVGVPTASSLDLPRVTYGWAHLHTLHRLLAAEEGLDLGAMQDFGGTRPWQDAATPLRLIFDLDYVNGEHPTSTYRAVADRLRDIHTRWSTAGPVDDGVPPSMKADQIGSLATMISVVDACVATGERLRVG